MEIWRAHLRLSLLRALAGLPGYAGNDALLMDIAADEGLVASRDQVRTELHWLQEQGLVTISDASCRLAERGADVAAGRAVVPGIKRPPPAR